MCRSIALPLIVKTRVIESAGPRDVHLAVTGEARRYYFPGISVKAFLPFRETSSRSVSADLCYRKWDLRWRAFPELLARISRKGW
jgi:hypothetical protein